MAVETLEAPVTKSPPAKKRGRLVSRVNRFTSMVPLCLRIRPEALTKSRSTVSPMAKMTESQSKRWISSVRHVLGLAAVENGHIAAFAQSGASGVDGGVATPDHRNPAS